MGMDSVESVESTSTGSTGSTGSTSVEGAGGASVSAVGGKAGAKRGRSDNRRRAHGGVPERVDVAIVGSGLGGLMSAAYLAQAGLRVAVFESHYVAGGCATQFSRGPKSARYHFDVGLHYVGDCEADGPIPRMLADVGASVDFLPMDQDGFDTLVFPDFRFRIPAELERYRDRLVAQFPHETRGIDKYVKLVDAVMKVSRTMERNEGKKLGLRDVASIALPGLRLAPHRESTIGEVLGGLVRDPKVVAIMLGQSGDYGLPPSKVSALLHMGLAGHYFRGAYYPRGGGQLIADRVAARVEAAGGTIHLRTPVERILVERGRAVGLRLAAKAGEPARDVRAELVISNADLKKTLLELVGPEHLPTEWLRKTERFEMAAALFMTFLGVEGELGSFGMGRTNYWQFDGYDVERFYATDRGEGPIGVAGCYVTSASMKDPESPGHAPPGMSTVEVMSVVPSDPRRWGVARGGELSWTYKHEATYLERKQGVEDDMVRRLEAMFPGVSARIRFRESATPMSHTRFTGASDGTGYGLAATPEQFMQKRPGYRGPLPGLYLTGASTRAGHGIVGAMMSGRAAAARVLRDRREASAHAVAEL
jgi:all-trans-retinol 13,14-reductase